MDPITLPAKAETLPKTVHTDFTTTNSHFMIIKQTLYRNCAAKECGYKIQKT